MHSFHSKTVRLAALAALSAALISGCGGGSSGGVAGNDPPPPPANQTVADVFGYINQLIAGNDANGEPIDINGLTLATDDTSEPAVVN